MNNLINTKIEYLINNIPQLVANFSYRSGPDLYFYQRVIKTREKSPFKSLFTDNYYFELLYATLVSWDMNSRGAKMMYFDDFKQNIIGNQGLFEELENFKLSQLSKQQFLEVQKIVGNLYEGLHVMKTGGRLVSNSKIMHFLLPELMMPMDRRNTLVFFFGNTTESKDKFLQIFEASWLISKQLYMGNFFDTEWNRFVPKIIDNAIICDQSLKYRKQIK